MTLSQKKRLHEVWLSEARPGDRLRVFATTRPERRTGKRNREEIRDAQTRRNRSSHSKSSHLHPTMLNLSTLASLFVRPAFQRDFSSCLEQTEKPSKDAPALHKQNRIDDKIPIPSR